MTRILLTGGSGFIATHILQLLLERGHSVVTTVRNSSKAENIKKAYPNFGPGQLDFAIVPDIAKTDAFDEAVVSNPPFEAVIHTASPFTFKVTDIQKDLLDPAINGTTGILHSIKKNAPTVNRVATSKTFAEKAAWDFVVNEKPDFTISTILPPLVFGPAVQALPSLDALNTSNQFILSFTSGAAKGGIPPTTNPLFVDVRDVAQAHVAAAEKPEAGGKRFFVVGGYMANRDIIEVIREGFPEYQDQLPPLSDAGGELPSDMYSFDNGRSTEILGLQYKSLKDCLEDTIRSFAAVGK
ncbi:hypothetical protein ACHAQA_004353 [Verticillium albo-atrum]